MHLAKELNRVIEKGRVDESLNTLLPLDDKLHQKKSIISKYRKLKSVHQLQRSLVRQNMHNAMSPISAISGYLELINLSLGQDSSTDRIERYREKIQSGINEVNTILEQLQDIYSEEDDDEVTELSVDFNWLVREACNLVQYSNSRLSFISSIRPIHVKTDLFVTKLIIFNLINNALKCSLGGETVKIETESSDGHATVHVCFQVTDAKKEELRVLFSDETLANYAENVRRNSFNEGLLSSVKLAEQIDGVIALDEVSDEGIQMSFTLPVSDDQ